MASSKWVLDATAENFDREVVDRSREVPVVVDFWAPWCGPCRALGPRLEAFAAERDGAFVLAKVNTDEQSQLAGAFHVQGIPAVFAIRDGKVVDQFTGVIPDDQLQAFIDRLSPSEAEKAAASALGLESTDPGAAETAYRAILAGSENDPAGRVGLARVLLATPGREVEAAPLLAGSGWGEHTPEAARLRTVLQLREVRHADADLTAARSAATAKAEDAEAQLRLGSVLAARGEYTAALGALLAAAEADRTLGRGAVRELMLKLFEVIGPQTPEAVEARKQLQSLLY